ncbi:signal transduction histidine kinase [Lachnospiraceae bacterium PF1-21]|uniref:hypothetical protein n=1 Tax=Ohessyouella blattaphilus TaxID=2949333 RepID=UPI003E1AD715
MNRSKVKGNRSRREMGKVFIMSTLLFAIVVIFIFSNLYFFRQSYRNQELKHVEIVKKEIDEALHSEEREEALQDLIERYAVEIVVVNKDNQVVFESLPFEKDVKLQGLINKQAKFVEGGGEVILDGKLHYVWYVIYRTTFVNQLEGFLLRQNLLVAVIFLVLFVLIILLLKNLLNPLYQVAESLEQAEQDNMEHFQGVSSTDPLNERLGNFFVRQRSALKEVYSKNTNLELALSVESDRLENTIQLSRALVHDLKGPVHQSLIENEIKLKHDELTVERKIALRSNIAHSQKLLQEINGILKVMREDLYNVGSSIETIDMEELILTSQNHNRPEMEKKKLLFSYEGPQDSTLNQSKAGVQLLIHNILTNLVHYTISETEIIVDVHKREEGILVITKNQSEGKDIDRMRRSERMDYVVKNHTADKDHTYSSGNGLYLIKDLAQMLGGEYKYEITGDLVTATLFLPDKEGEE